MASASPQKPYNKTKYFLLSYLIHFILNVWYFFIKKAELRIPPASQALIDQGRGYIIAGFHEATLSLFRHTTGYLQKQKGAKMVALVSQSKDGEIIHQTFARSNLSSIRGSSTRGGTGAFRSILKAMKEGQVPIFTVDGPKGPRHEVKPGIIAAASLSQLPILYLHSQYNLFWRFNSWDRHFFPKWRARLHIWYGEPFRVPKGLDEAGIEEWALKLQAEMLKLEQNLETEIRSLYPNNSIDVPLNSKTLEN